MTMLRSFLIISTYNWIIKHNFTPYLLIDASYKNTLVPKNCLDKDNKILFNISSEAVKDFICKSDKIKFKATFNSQAILIEIPSESVLELYAKETSQGIYAREFSYGIDVLEGNDKHDINPKK